MELWYSKLVPNDYRGMEYLESYHCHFPIISEEYRDTIRDNIKISLGLHLCIHICSEFRQNISAKCLKIDSYIFDESH